MMHVHARRNTEKQELQQFTADCSSLFLYPSNTIDRAFILVVVVVVMLSMGEGKASIPTS